MSEENNVETSSEQTTVPSLDETINQFAADLPDPVQNTPAETKPVESPAIPTGFDPLDESSVNQFSQQNAQAMQGVASQVQELSAKLDAYQQEKAQAEVSADINRAVDLVAEESGLDNRDYVEFRLSKLADANPNWQKLWDNRHTKPEALDAALKAAAHEMKGELDFKADPQLAENHRAAQESTNTSQDTTESKYSNALGERLGEAKSPAERDRIWRQIMNGG